MLRRLAVLDAKIDALSVQVASSTVMQTMHQKWLDKAEDRIRNVEAFAIKSRAINAVLALVISASITITPAIIRSQS